MYILVEAVAVHIYNTSPRYHILQLLAFRRILEFRIVTYKNDNLNFVPARIILLLISILKHFGNSNLNLEIA